MKTNMIAAAVVASALLIPQAYAANEVTDAKSCMAQLKDVRAAQAEGTDLGEKDEKVLKQITGVIESLCGRKNWKDATSLLEVARTMMATE